jgi:FKBP-type peptidyl-prolyl cis-trans isomerase
MVKISLVLCLTLLSVGCIADDAAAPNTVEFTQENEDGDVKKTTEPEKKPEINIEVVILPGDCTRKTRRLDVLSMKYTGYLENGTKFEST